MDKAGKEYIARATVAFKNLHEEGLLTLTRAVINRDNAGFSAQFEKPVLMHNGNYRITHLTATAYAADIYDARTNMWLPHGAFYVAYLDLVDILSLLQACARRGRPWKSSATRPMPQLLVERLASGQLAFL